MDPLNHLSPERIIGAYKAGYFPMSEARDDDSVFWLDPPLRGVIFPQHLHIPKKFAKFRRNFPHEIKTDTGFRAVMQACASEKYGRDETWISQPILQAYGALHDCGVAHSFEVFSDGRLTGGLYGLSIGAAFFGESMFGAQTGVSKIALACCAERLFSAGYHFIDTQFWTPHLGRFGCREIKKEAYLRHLSAAVAAKPSTAVFGG